MEKIKIKFNTIDSETKFNVIKDELKKKVNPEFELDLRSMNLIDASKTALLASVEIMRKNTNSKISCLVKDKQVLNIITPRKLKNMTISVNLNEKTTKERKYRNIYLKKTGSGT